MTSNANFPAAPALPGLQRVASIAHAMAVLRCTQALALACLLLGMLAIALHVPGQISMDSSIQLYEAAIGRSVSWAPPFMSALLRWLGGGELGATGLVVLDTVLIYGAYAVAAASLGRLRMAQGQGTLPIWRAAFALVLMANPIVLGYAGIIWKDVLFAALLTAGCALGLAALAGTALQRVAMALLSSLLLAAALLTRQQGLFMAPALLAVPIIALWPAPRAGQPRTAAFSKAALLVLSFVVGIGGFNLAAHSSIASENGRATSVGFRSIMLFDLAGIVSLSQRTADEFDYPISAAQLAAVRSVYDPSRIDFLDREPLASQWLAVQSEAQLRRGWWQMVKQNPVPYLTHRWRTYSVLMGLHGIAGTLPLHIGVEGNPGYLHAVGFSEGRNARALLVYRMVSPFFKWPIYRHIFWLGSMLAGIAWAIRVRIEPRLRAASFSLAAACILLYASFLPTTIASDFRYLFAGIPLVTLQWLILLLAPKATHVETRP